MRPVAESRDHLRRLADEHAAVRRIASLVTTGAPDDELFGAVVEEVVRVLDVTGGWLGRYEPDRSITVLACVNDSGFPAGTRWPLDGPSVCATVLDTGRPARIDDFTALDGTIAERTRGSGFRSCSGVPIAVDGTLWGVLAVGTGEPQPVPGDADDRLRDFTELMVSAISGVESRNRARRLADGQAALRRTATLVAEGAPGAELFAVVAEEVVRVVDVPSAAVCRFEPDSASTVVGAANAPGFPVGSRWPTDGPGIAATVLETGRPARVDDYAGVESSVATGMRRAGLRSTVGVPIVVDASIWGMIVAAADAPLPPGTEARVSDFTDLLAIAISNAQSRDRLRRVADQQTALRRVATLVAEGATQDALFDTVATEVARILDASSVAVVRYESAASVVVASVNDPDLPVGGRWPFDGPRRLFASIFETGGPAQVDAGVGVPIVVNGAVWGAITVGSRRQRETLPAYAGSYTGRLVLSLASAHDVELRLAAFTELVATAISKAHADAELRRLAAEQTALRRVATLVAEAAAPEQIFDGVAGEVAHILELPWVELVRYEADGTGTVIGASGEHPFAVGSHWEIDGPSVMASVLATRRPARIDDYRRLPGTIAGAAHSAGFSSAIGAPIIVGGSTWGAIIAMTTGREAIPEQSEVRLGEFTELVATAVSNATARADLLASRARIVAAGDAARRRFERNLHDGTQQRLLALRLDLQRIRATIPDSATQAELEEVEHELEMVLEEVREVSRGLHPALLSRGGLGPSLNALARKSPIAATVEIDLAERPPPPIETAVYYVVSEAFTNAIKHSRAASITVRVVRDGDVVRATIADDGVGGAKPEAGSGLTGLHDRVEALGGRFALDSARDRGTRISIELPLVTPVTP